MQIAPFLISKSKRSGYRVVVAPSFLKADTANNLASWIAPEGDDDAAIYRREVKGTPDGDLTFFFRGNFVKDRSDANGRRFARIEGICMRSDDAERFCFNTRYLLEAERANDKHFEAFWDWDKTHPILMTDERITFDPTLPTDVSPFKAADRVADAPKDMRNQEGRKKSRNSSAREAPKKNGKDVAGELDGLAGGENAQDSKVKHSIFRSVCAVALGCTGVAVATNGVWGLKSDRPEDQRQRNWKRLFLRLGEIGLGVGLTWAAFVVGRANLAAVRR